jgi:hypothetical protein
MKFVGLTQRTVELIGKQLPGKEGLTVIAGAGALMGLAAAGAGVLALEGALQANKDKKVLNKVLLYAAAAGTGVLALEGAVQAYDLVKPRLGCSDCKNGCNVACGGCC